VYVPYDGKLDVEEFIDEGIVKLAGASDGVEAQQLIDRTFTCLAAAKYVCELLKPST
jgi:hypothetical protein